MCNGEGVGEEEGEGGLDEGVRRELGEGEQWNRRRQIHLQHTNINIGVLQIHTNTNIGVLQMQTNAQICIELLQICRNIHICISEQIQMQPILSKTTNTN